MKDIIETLTPMNRCLLGEGYDSAMEYLKHLIDLEVIEIPSGTELGTWTVPDEWIVRDAWVKYNGEKIIDYKTEPMSLVVGSLPFEGVVTRDELMNHLHFNEEQADVTPYVFKYYDKDWGFCVPKNQVKEMNTEVLAGVKLEDGSDYVPKFKNKLPEGNYEVFIDTEYVPGKMKIGVHTKKGDDKEILLFAHLDHPFQANDNLSGVACLVDLATKLHSNHTIKIIFCPETIGSIGYAMTQDISNVVFAIAVDICGNDESIVLQKSYIEDRINSIAHLAIQNQGETYRKGMFRNLIGSDEYYFNDPQVGIPAILLSRHPYPQYHTNQDTPDKISYEKIEQMGEIIQDIIRIYEEDYIPVKEFKGPLMRSRYNLQTPSPQLNLSYDYFMYGMNGKKYLSELCCDYGLNFDFTRMALMLMKNDGFISRGSDAGETKQQPIAKQKHSSISGRTNVRRKSKKVS